MNKALILSLALTLSLLGGAASTYAKDGDSAKDKTFNVTIKAGKSETILNNARVRGSQSLFSSGSGKTEIEVRKGGGPLKIKVLFSKIRQIDVVNVTPDAVEIEITSASGDKKLRGTVPPNLELVGETEFGEGSIKIRDAELLKFAAAK